MKTKGLFYSLLVGIIVVLSSCGATIIPSKNYVTQEYSVDAFHMIDFRGVGNVKYLQNDTQQVEIKGPDNLVPLYKVKVENGTLIIDIDHGNKMKKSGKVDILISSPVLTRIENSGVGNFDAPETVRSEEFSITNSGVGNFYMGNLESSTVVANFSGVGNAEIKGKCTYADFRVSVVGNFDTEGLIASDLILNASGVGNVSCYASESIQLNCSGVGEVQYAGNPSKKEISKSGVGKVVSK